VSGESAGDIPHLLNDNEVARILRYRDTAAFRRHRKALEAQGFPKRRPIVRRYSPTEIKAWVDGRDLEPQQSDGDPLLEVTGQWGTSN
jgi:hypothetical protein